MPTEAITDDLRDDILTGHFPPGERLVEGSLTDRYRCGRNAVRAALVELSTEGLVERSAHRGATVRRISVAEAIQITEARAALESLVASHAARDATAEDCRDLKRIVADMRAAVRADDQGAYSALNVGLHRRIVLASGHTVAGELISNLRNRAAHHQYRLAVMPGRAETSLGQHRAIVAAIVAGDQDRAAAEMDLHLRSVIEVLSRWSEAPA